MFDTSRGLECGPNLTRGAELEHQQRLQAQEAQNSPDHVRVAQQPIEGGQQGALSGDELRKEAFAKYAFYSPFKELHSDLSRRLEYINILAIIRAYHSCDRFDLIKHGYDWTESFKILVTILQKVVEELHTSFIRVVELGFLAVENGLHDLAQLLFSRLLHPLDEHQVLYDDSKRKSLLRIARYLQERQLECEAARVFERITRIHDLPKILHDIDPRDLLAKSFTALEDLASPVLRDLWQKVYGSGQAPQNCNLPAWHRAARQHSCELADAVLMVPASHHLYGDLLGQGMLHFAAAMGSRSMVEAALRANGPIDSRDKFSRTALMVAAANGYSNVCSRLLECHADPQSRDCLCRTVLEIAAAQCHLEVVEVLVNGGARVNPRVAGVNTPILAAIGSHNQERDNVGVIRYLLYQGADVHFIPPGGTNNAIGAAGQKGLAALATEMLQLQPPNPSIWAPGFLDG